MGVKYLSDVTQMCIMEVTQMCRNSPTNISLRVTSKELAEIDSNWRGNLDYKNRADYIREKLGLKRLSDE